MISVNFQNVGQGDSIILEWEKNGKKHIGIIDCKVIDGENPTLEYLRNEKEFNLEFIILSHFHEDHYSGMADIFQYCIDNKIKVEYFYHSLASFLGDFYNKIFTSKKVEAEVSRFFEAYDKFDSFVENKIPVHAHIANLPLNENTILSFLAPLGNIYDTMAKQLSRKVNKITTTRADINKLSTIVMLQNKTQCILLTSDSVKKSFKRLRNKISYEVVLAQVPHHGSFGSLDEDFWCTLKKVENCPAVFSIGDEPKDKLPNEETVSFFDKNNYDIHSTNYVYGIESYYGPLSPKVANISRSKVLNSFSKLRAARSSSVASAKFIGDQKFSIFEPSLVPA